MYSVVEIKGHQYRVSPGDVIDVEKIEAEVGQTLSFDDVLFVGGENPVLGFPKVQGAKITAKVVKQDRSKKILMMKRKPGKYQKKKGHRQSFTCLFITTIEDGRGQKQEIDNSSERAKKFLN